MSWGLGDSLIQRARIQRQLTVASCYIGDDALPPSSSAPNLKSLADDLKTPLLPTSTCSIGSSALPPARQIATSPLPLSYTRIAICTRLERIVPILEWLPRYDWRTCLKGDVIGGIIIGIVLVCQTMAHAAIATTSPVQGPYCALAPAFTYAIFGSTRHASISSGAVAAMLIAEQLEEYSDINTRTQMASLLALLVGGILTIFGICRAAFVVRFMSEPCLSGFVSAASFVIVASQIKHFLGISEHVTSVNGFFNNIYVVIHHMFDINVFAIAIGVFCIVGIQTMKTFKIRYKNTGKYQFLVFMSSFKEIIVVIIATLFAAVTAGDTDLIVTRDGKLSTTGTIVPTIGHVPEGLPGFDTPWNAQFVPDDIHRHVVRLLPAAGVIALTTYLTTYASSKRVAMQQGYDIAPNQEAIALGLAGVAGSFFGAFPPSGSLSRASLLPQVGISTQVGGMVASIVVGLSLSFLANGFFFIPRASLSGIIILASYGLQDFKYLFWLLDHSRMWGKPQPYDKSAYTRGGGLYKDVFVWICAFAVTLFCGVVDGILAAIVLSFFLLVKSAVKPAVVVLGHVAQFNMWRDVRYWATATRYTGILVVTVRAPLFFGNSEFVQKRINTLVEAYDEPVQYVIFDAGAIHSVDATALKCLQDMLSTWKDRGICCIISNANGQVRGLLHTHLAYLQQVSFYLTTEDAVLIARKIIAARRRRSLKSIKFDSETEAALTIQRALRKGRIPQRRMSCL